MATLRTLDEELVLRQEVDSGEASGGLLPILLAGVLCTLPLAELQASVGGALIEDSITNGVTDKAPSQNAVYDALALKADVSALASYLTTADASTTYLTQVNAALAYQPLDSDLTAIAALSTTSYGRGFLTLADTPAAFTKLGLGTAAAVNTGTSGATVPLLNGVNTWSGAQTLTATLFASASSGDKIRLIGDGSVITFYNGSGTRRGYIQHDSGTTMIVRNEVTNGDLQFLVAGTGKVVTNGPFAVNSAGTGTLIQNTANDYLHTIDKDNTGVLFATNSGSRGFRFSIAGGVGLSIGPTLNTFGYTPVPYGDAALNLGASGQRWATVFASTGTINTSDMEEKTEFEDLAAQDIVMARDIFTQSGWYKWHDSVAKKGSAARRHFGLGAQRVGRAARAVNYDPTHLAFFCGDALEDGTVRLGLRPDQLHTLGISALYRELDTLRAELDELKLAA